MNYYYMKNRLLIYLIFALNIAVIGFYSYVMFNAIRRGEFHMDLRNIVFVVDLIGTLLYAVTFLLRFQTWSMKMLEIISSWIESMAFHGLLYLWSVFLMQVRHSPMVYLFRVVVAFGAFSATCATIGSIVTYNLPSSKILRKVAVIMGYWLPVSQLVVAVAFASFALNFYTKRRGVGSISPSTVQALQKLGQLAVIAFACYVALGVCNLDFVSTSVQSPGALAAVVLVRIIAGSIRGLSLLTVLGFKAPSKGRKNVSEGKPSVSKVSDSGGSTFSSAPLVKKIVIK